jgi:hypothetical protein
MTLVEFLAPLASRTNQARVVAVLYFSERYDNSPAITVSQIRTALIQARTPRARSVNVSDVLNKSAHLVDSAGVVGRQRLWRLTDSGRAEVRALLSLPAADVELEHDVGLLTSVSGRIADEDCRTYMEEAIKCLQVGALRACVVFAWAGAIKTLQQRLLTVGNAALTSALTKHDPKCKPVSKVEDFAYVKDSLTLLVAKELNILDKNQRDTLDEALGLRNRCGHPGKYRPGPKKVSGFVEDIVSIVFG